MINGLYTVNSLLKEKAKKTLKEQMIARAGELHKQGKGCGTIAKIIAQEFHEKEFDPGTIVYWIKKYSFQ